MKEYLEIGKIVGTHGVRGMVRIQPWCDSISLLKGVKSLYTDCSGTNALSVCRIAENGNVFIAQFTKIDSIESAEKLRGKTLYAKRNDLKIEKGSYFIQDIIGCTVIDSDDKTIVYGKVSDVTATGANDVWHIKNGDKEYLIPVIPSVVNDVDVENSVVIITPLKGIFDNED